MAFGSALLYPAPFGASAGVPSGAPPAARNWALLSPRFLRSLRASVVKRGWLTGPVGPAGVPSGVPSGPGKESNERGRG
jgi:hypothetical protein